MATYAYSCGKATDDFFVDLRDICGGEKTANLRNLVWLLLIFFETVFL